MKVVRLPQGSTWVEARYSFECEAVPETRCTTIISLVKDGEGEEREWKIWVIRTVLEGLKGVGSVDELQLAERIENLTNGHVNGQMNGHREEKPFECVVIGGGLAGLSTGGRLKALGVKYVVVDKNENVGDNWKLRYGSARCESFDLLKCRT